MKQKTQEQLITELNKLRQRIAALEKSERENKKLGKALRTERDKAQQYLDIAQVMLVALDKKGMITFLNHKGDQILGYKTGELIGKNWFTTCLPSYLRKDVKNVFRELMAGEIQQTEFYENPVLTKSGTERIIAWHHTVLKDAQGTIIGTLSSGEDITDRKRVEDTLKETNLFLRSILDSSSSISIIYTDLEQNILFWNKGAENIFGYKAEEVINRHTVDILYPDEEDTKQKVEEIRSYILNKKRGLRREIKELSKDGRILWINLTSTPRFDENGNVIGILGIGEDITDRKRAEETLFHINKAVESSSDAIGISNAQGHHFYHNKAFTELFEYTPEELEATGGGPAAYVNKKVARQVFNTIMSGGSWSGEVQMVSKSGRKFPVLLRADAIKDQSGKVIGLIGVHTDITERNQAEEQLKILSLAVDQSPNSVAILNKKGIVEYVNNRFLEAYGYNLKEIVGKNWRSFLSEHSTLREALQEIQSTVIDRGMVWKGEVSDRTADGAVIWRAAKVVPIKNAQGELVHITYISEDITERKRAEEALRESEEKYRNLAERANDGIGIGQNGIIRYANARLAQMGGYTVEELIGVPFLDFFMPDEVPKIRDNYKRRMAGEDIPSIYETALKHKDGRRLAVELNAGIIHYQGSPAELVIIRDITERKRTEETLRETAEKYRVLTNSAMDGFSEIDQDGHFLDVNEESCRMSGYSRDEHLTMSILDMEAVETSDKTKSHLQNIIETGSDRFESRIHRKDGSIIDIEVSISFSPQTGHFLIFHRDITERKQAEEALKESEEKFRSLAEQSPNMIFINVKGQIVYANEQCTKIMGYTRKELYSPDFDFLTLIAPEAIDLVKTLYGKHMEGKEAAPYEYALITKDGRKIEVIITTKLIQYGGERALLGVVTDITGRKKVEEQLQQSYQQLQEMLITMVNALASTIEMKDQYTAGHQPRVTELACAIAEEMGLPEGRTEGIRMAGLVHDIGKIMVPAEILNKPGPLTEIQYDMVKMHPQASYEILKDIKFPWPVAEIVLQHQELMDGSGYPHGLPGEEILLEARILTVANVVEAMVSHRPYRAAYDIKEALAEIAKNKGILYDPMVVDACLKLFAEKRFTFD